MNISIIVLTYNHGKYIKELLESLKYQIKKYNEINLHSVQVIVSDDCSQDNTIQMIKEWVSRNERIFNEFILLDNEKNQGTCKNYLNALSKTSGDYIKAIGGDDIFPPISIFSIMKKLDEYDIVYGIPFIYKDYEDNDLKIIWKQYEKLHCQYIEEEKLPYYKRIHRQCFLNAPATYVSKNLLKDSKVIRFLETYKYIDDYSQWLKISEIKNIRTYYIDDFTIIYRRTMNSTYCVKGKILQEEIIRIYHYAQETCNDWKSKVLLQNELNMLIGKYPFKIGDLGAYIRNFYWLKNRKRIPFSINNKKIKEILNFVEKNRLSVQEKIK